MSGHSEGVITEQTHDMDQKREQNRQEKDKTNNVTGIICNTN